MGIELFKSFGTSQASEPETEGVVDRSQVLSEIEASGASWFWTTDETGKVAYLSVSAVDELCASPSDVIGKQLSEIFVPEIVDGDAQDNRPLAFQIRARNKITEMSVRVSLADQDGKSKQGSTWWSISGRPYFDSEGGFRGYRGSAKDITADFERQRDASRMSQYDSLTGLANRHRMSKRIEATLNAFKTAQRSFALLMLDLDRFKQVNDTLGHQAGDELLKQVAQRLEGLIGERGEIGRLGGDEFQIILPDQDDRGTLGDLAGRVVQMLSQPYSIDGKRAIIGTSVGVAIAPYDGTEVDDLVRAADLALYAAKGSGRGQYCFYTTDLKDHAAEVREIEEELRDALVNGGLEMNYQPLVRPQDDTVRGFEALMRWNHPDRGPISPAVFIPIAEESNLINQLGEWALRQACEDAAQWPGDLRVAVNVSAKQFATDNLPDIVQSALKRHNLDPNRLELEITESVFVGDTEAVDSMFKRLKKVGVRLALDDFGTGYSSLGYLKRAPFDKIKIDQSFVRGSTEEQNTNAAIVSAIVTLANALEMETTAEGVEAMDELELVRDRGAHLVQGYIYSKPLAQEAVLEKIGSGDFVLKPEGPPRYRSERMTVYRRVGLIHEDHYYEVMLRNLSRTGARVEGIAGATKGTRFVMDLGGGQLVVAVARRAEEISLGLEFESKLIDDGNGGLVTRQRVSPYSLAAAGMPLQALPDGSKPMREHFSKPTSAPKFMEVRIEE